MQMNDSQRIPAAKEKVWAALNDPAVLKQCIPGCQSLEMSSPTGMNLTRTKEAARAETDVG
jgi:carbon monoxide dehydrogenase subunit G